MQKTVYAGVPRNKAAHSICHNLQSNQYILVFVNLIIMDALS